MNTQLSFRTVDRASLSSTLRRLTVGVAVVALMAGLTACGGGGGDGGANAAATGATVQITGVAAVGAAIANQTVTVTNALGVSQAAQTNTNGGFTVTIADAAPYVISVVDGAGKTWYSYTPAAGSVNVNPMTTMALLSANGNQPLDVLVSNWAQAALTQAAVLDAAKKVNANLQNVMAANSVPYTSTNIFKGAFVANGTGMDAVLDDLGISFSCNTNSCTQIINWYSGAGTTTIAWDNSIDTTGITLSWQTNTGGSGSGSGSGTGGSTGGTIGVSLGSCSSQAQPGTYSMVVRTSVAGLGAVPIPEICVDGLPGRPVDQTDFCGDSEVTSQLPPGVSITSCSFSGNTGSIGARITSPFTLDYTVSYTFVLR